MLCILIITWIINLIRKKFTKITFANKTVWVTGASSGIGEFMVYRLSELGANIIISARRETELERVRKNCQYPDKVKIYTMDFSNPQEILTKSSDYIKKNDLKVDIIINNAGVSVRSSVVDNAFENEKHIMNVNYLSQVALTKAILPSMLERKNGHIVYINSIQGKVGLANRAGYAASKHALTGFADSLRAEVEDNGVFVSTIYPGYVKTNIAKAAMGSEAGSLYGKTDGNIAQGMAPDVFAEKALRAIYFKEKDAVLPDRFVNGLVVPLRNLIPNLVFWIVKKKKYADMKLKDE